MISNLQEKVAKGRGIVKEVSEAFKAVNLEETAKQLVQVIFFINFILCYWILDSIREPTGINSFFQQGPATIVKK